MLVVAIAFLAGILIGLTGTGAGAVLTPLLLLVTPFSAATVIGTDLLSGAITKLAGVWEHRRQGQVNWKLAAWLLGGSLPGTLVGILVLHVFEARMSADRLDHLLRILLGLTLFGVSLFLPVLRRRKLRLTAPSAGGSADELSDRLKMTAMGAVVGFLVAMTSVGSGSLMMIALLVVVPLPLASLVGTDILFGLVTTALAGSLHFAMGHVDPKLLLLLIAGEVPGVALGSRLTRRVPERYFTWLFSALNFILGARLLIG
ncbi:MAG: hypothetical protein DMG21_07020 [Acidobacteria bacterium]|nr:MAG: hypothetical protein DMG21_07020 [Acidobacteriota bacterium]